MEDLRVLLGEALYAQVTEKLGDSKGLYLHEAGAKVIVDDGKMIPKYRLEEEAKKRENMQALIDQNERDMKELKRAAAGNSDLTAQIEALQKASRDAKVANEQAEVTLRKSFAIKEALMNAQVMDPDARDLLAMKFDPAKVELDPATGKVKGIDEMLKPLKENKAFSAMFGKTVAFGQAHGQGGTPDAGVEELSAKLAAAQKTGNLVEVVALKRQMWEAQQEALKKVS